MAGKKNAAIPDEEIQKDAEITENEGNDAENNVNEGKDELAELKAKLAQLEAKLERSEANRGDTESGLKSGALRDISRERDDDYVEIKLFKDGSRYKDDVFVGINGTMCQIKRGVPVRVKRSFAKVLAAAENDSAIVNS